MLRGKQMEFIEHKYLDGTLIKPKHDQDIQLFRHCSEGSIAVTPLFFHVITEPLLKHHGILQITKEIKTE